MTMGGSSCEPQGKHVDGNQEGGVDIKKMRTWRQYMNRCAIRLWLVTNIGLTHYLLLLSRRGGFNRYVFLTVYSGPCWWSDVHVL